MRVRCWKIGTLKPTDDDDWLREKRFFSDQPSGGQRKNYSCTNVSESHMKSTFEDHIFFSFLGVSDLWDQKSHENNGDLFDVPMIMSLHKVLNNPEKVTHKSPIVDLTNPLPFLLASPPLPKL